jgi:hypothetical protein
VEADFRREYNIRLVSALSRMSWREFIVLVRGLGPHSATAVKLMNRRYAMGSAGKHDTTGVPIVRGKAAVARYFGVQLGGDDQAPGKPAEPS